MGPRRTDPWTGRRPSVVDVESMPPETSTRPSCSSVTAGTKREWTIEPANDQVPSRGRRPPRHDATAGPEFAHDENATVGEQGSAVILPSDDHPTRGAERLRRRIEQLRAIKRAGSGPVRQAAAGHQHATIEQGRGGVSVTRLGHHAGGPAEGVRAGSKSSEEATSESCAPPTNSTRPSRSMADGARSWSCMSCIGPVGLQRPASGDDRSSSRLAADDAACQETQCQNRQERPPQHRPIRQSGGLVRPVGDHRRARPDGRSRRRRTAARRWLRERGDALRDAPRSRAGQSSRSSVRRRARRRASRARVPDGERPVARASSVESNPAT